MDRIDYSSYSTEDLPQHLKTRRAGIIAEHRKAILYSALEVAIVMGLAWLILSILSNL